MPRLKPASPKKIKTYYFATLSVEKPLSRGLRSMLRGGVDANLNKAGSDYRFLNWDQIN